MRVECARTEADDVVVARATMHDIPSPRVVLDPPDEPLRATFDLPDPFPTCHGGPGELVSAILRGRVQHNSDLTQLTRQLVLDAADMGLRVGVGAPLHFAHAAQEVAELPCTACLDVWCVWGARGERRAAREIRREGDGKGGLEDWQGRPKIAGAVEATPNNAEGIHFVVPTPRPSNWAWQSWRSEDENTSSCQLNSMTQGLSLSPAQRLYPLSVIENEGVQVST